MVKLLQVINWFKSIGKKGSYVYCFQYEIVLLTDKRRRIEETNVIHYSFSNKRHRNNISFHREYHYFLTRKTQGLKNMAVRN